MITEWGTSNFNLAKPFIVRSGSLMPLLTMVLAGLCTFMLADSAKAQDKHIPGFYIKGCVSNKLYRFYFC